MISSYYICESDACSMCAHIHFRIGNGMSTWAGIYTLVNKEFAIEHGRHQHSIVFPSKMVDLSILMLNYQRVHPIQSHFIIIKPPFFPWFLLWFSYSYQGVGYGMWSSHVIPGCAPCQCVLTSILENDNLVGG